MQKVLTPALGDAIELKDSKVVFYNRDKSKNFEIDYTDIDYVWKVPFLLVWQVEPLNWQIQILLRRDVLKDYPEEVRNSIDEWFPPRYFLPIASVKNKFDYFLTIFCSQRNLLLESFDKHGVVVTERFVYK